MRLDDGYRPRSDDDWSSWEQAEQVLGAAPLRRPHELPPHKRYPRAGHYFTPQVAQALFPPDAGGGGRWIRRPGGLVLRIGAANSTTFALHADLLEVVQFALAPHVTYGLMHLTVPDPIRADQMLSCSGLLMTRYRKSDVNSPRFELVDGSEAEVLRGNEPLTTLAGVLFGSAHPTLSRRAHVCAVARIPDEVADGDLSAWRRALGRGATLAQAKAALRDAPSRDDKRRTEVGQATVLVFALSTSVTHRAKPGDWLRNVRSYWVEALLFALVQHVYVENYAVRLATLGSDPLSEPIGKLYVDWLSFRNVFWWRRLAATDVASTLRALADTELGTTSLFEDLEASFSTYVQERSRRTDEREAKSLRSLQVYGAAFAAVSTVSAILQVAGEDYLDCLAAQVAVCGSLVGLGVGVAVGTSRWLRKRDTEAG